eukprot:9091971-Pyramimonas_sp.AAC.1
MAKKSRSMAKKSRSMAKIVAFYAIIGVMAKINLDVVRVVCIFAALWVARPDNTKRFPRLAGANEHSATVASRVAWTPEEEQAVQRNKGSPPKSSK